MGKVGVSRDRECPKEELMLARLGKSHKTTQFQYQFNDESARLMGAASAEYLLQLVFYSHHITALHPGHLEQRLDVMGAQSTELDTEHTTSCDTARLNRYLIDN